MDPEQIKEQMRAKLKAARDITVKADSEGRSTLTEAETQEAAGFLKEYEAHVLEAMRACSGPPPFSPGTPRPKPGAITANHVRMMAVQKGDSRCPIQAR